MSEAWQFAASNERPTPTHRYGVTLYVTTPMHIIVDATDPEDAEAQAIDAYRRGAEFETDKPIIDFDETTARKL